jgi:tetratricopeptide (TPR) repeat protein
MQLRTDRDMPAMNHPSEGTLLVRSVAQLLDEGRQQDLAGRSSEAMECYAAVIDLTAGGGDQRARAEALRRLSVLHHLRAEPEVASDLCTRSHDIAVQTGAQDLAADASNALAGFALERGDLAGASELYQSALGLANQNPALVGKIEQNLGIIANIRGNWDDALEHYHRSRQAYASVSDQRGCAIAHHNLGMIHARRQEWEEADRHYRRCCGLAEAAGDRHLGGLAAMNRAEVRLAIDDLEGARAGAEQALRIFNEVEARRDKAGAHRLLGMVFRHRGQMALAESHLRSALEIAASTECPLTEAYAAKELAHLYHTQRRRDAALNLLERARTIYQRLEAAADLKEVVEQIASMDGGTPLSESTGSRGPHA